MEFIFNRFAMKHVNQMGKEQLDEYDGILNHPANEWLVYFWVMGVLDLPPELKRKPFDSEPKFGFILARFSDNAVLSQLQSEMQNPDRARRHRDHGQLTAQIQTKSHSKSRVTGCS